MQTFLTSAETTVGQRALNWVAVALGVIVLFAPVTSVCNAGGGSEIADLEQEECSVEITEARAEERQRREPSMARIAHSLVANQPLPFQPQLCVRRSERDSLNGTGSWLRL